MAVYGTTILKSWELKQVRYIRPIQKQYLCCVGKVNRDNRTTYNQALLSLRQANGMHVHPEGLLSLPAGKRENV